LSVLAQLNYWLLKAVKVAMFATDMLWCLISEALDENLDPIQYFSSYLLTEYGKLLVYFHAYLLVTMTSPR